MIVFDLICSSQHRFEGWFASKEDFERQRDRGMLCCPVCATSEIRRLLSARIAKGRAGEVDQRREADVETKSVPKKQEATLLAGFLDLLLNNTEDVGRAFPDEARKIHYEEAPRRGIRGVATKEEARDLVDEGIQVFPLPAPPQNEWH
jgi:hypothetical protein